MLVGPFDFSTPIHPAKSSAKVDIKFWNFLSKSCKKFSILPPVLSQSEKSSIVCASRFRATLPSVSEQSLCASSSSLFYTSLLFPKREGVSPSHLQEIVLVPDNYISQITGGSQSGNVAIGENHSMKEGDAT